MTTERIAELWADTSDNFSRCLWLLAENMLPLEVKETAELTARLDAILPAPKLGIPLSVEAFNQAKAIWLFTRENLKRCLVLEDLEEPVEEASVIKAETLEIENELAELLKDPNDIDWNGY